MFFLGGTIFFMVIFMGISIHSVTVGIPEQTNADQIDEAVLLGRTLWDENNCMGCHTLMGEGAYYAPELTRVYDRKGPDYIRTVLGTKNGWGPRGRKMVAYDFTPEEIEGLVAFFEWINKANLNGFPPEPTLSK